MESDEAREKRRAREREYYRNNKARIDARNLAYRLRNIDDVRAKAIDKAKIRYRKNPAAILKRAKENRQKYRDKINAHYLAKYYEKKATNYPAYLAQRRKYHNGRYKK